MKSALRTILVPRPRTAAVGGQPLKDEALLGWCREVIDQVIDRQPVAVGTSA
jgi:transcription-repair coupling factor (superfamily II helicase)